MNTEYTNVKLKKEKGANVPHCLSTLIMWFIGHKEVWLHTLKTRALDGSCYSWAALQKHHFLSLHVGVEI
jgi:hypothetical protein